MSHPADHRPLTVARQERTSVACCGLSAQPASMTNGLRTNHARLASLLILLTATALWPVDPGSADCASPYLQIGDNPRPVLSPDFSVTVAGRAFVKGCNDQPAPLGCSTSREEEEVPSTDVALIVRQGTRHWDLGSEDAGIAATNELGQITWEVMLPRQLRLGPAVFIADSARLEVTVER